MKMKLFQKTLPLLLALALLAGLCFGLSMTAFAADAPASPAAGEEGAPAEGEGGFDPSQMDQDDLFAGGMQKPQADKKDIADTATQGGMSSYTKLALAALAGIFAVAILLIVIPNAAKFTGKKYIGFLTAAICFLLVVGIVANYLALIRYPLVMNKTFGKGTATINQVSGSENWDSQYVKTTASSRDEAIAAAEDHSVSEMAEGAVLMKNENNALPLSSSETKVTLLGVNTASISAGSQGEGTNAMGGEQTTLADGLTQSGFSVNPSTVELYSKLYYSDDYKFETKLTNTTDESMAITTVYKYGHNSAGFSNQEPWMIGEVETSWYTDEIESTYANYSDAAIVTLTRVGGEGSDLATDMGIYADYGGEAGKHYLELDTTEEELIRYAKAHFSKVIVLINSSNVMELGSLNEAKTDSNLGVDAILWIGGVGSVGTKAIGDLLTGKINPSGRTCDIWPADLTADPTWNNFGTYQYSNVDASNSTDGHAFSVEYEEGIYIGYRYYETAGAEADAGNYASYHYDSAVVYPFGYGLSYTTFDMSYASEPTLTDGQFRFDVNVTNTGSAAGKQVVQIYVESPYTYGGIEKSKVVLAGFGKTDLLQPGDSQTVTITIARDDLASYDYQNAKSYVLDAGSYKFYLSENSHSWASIDPSDTGKCYTYDQADTVTYNSDGTRRASDEVVAVNQFDDITNYHFVDYTDSRAGSGYAHNMTRADFAASFPTAPTEADLVADETVLAGINYKVSKDDKGDDSMLPTTGASNGLVLADLRGVDYDDPLWDDLLDQLTVGDMHDLCAYGHFETAELASVAAPYTADIDSPNGLINFFQPDLKSNGYPTEPVLASTWNVELARERGECIGEELIFNGLNGWYGPGANTHRSAFGGRNNEYFSEDGLLAGKMLAAECSGAETKGVLTYTKHFAFNDQEANRNSVLCTWVNEQAAREIYLKGFEVCAKEAVAEVTYLDDNGNQQTVEMQGIGGVMTAYNMVGPIWTGGCEGLVHTILRDEWGLDGSAITDGIGANYVYANADQAIRHGSDLLLAYDLQMEDTESPAAIAALRESAHHVLYAKANSNAMNGLVSGATITYGTAPWMITLIVCDLAAAVLIGISVLLIVRRKSTGSAKGAKA